MRLSQFSCLEILKFTVAVAIGFTFRILIETSHPRSVVYSPVSDTKSDEYGPLHDQLREPYEPLDRDEIIHYQFVKKSYLYDVPKREPKWKMLKHEHKDLADVMRRAVNQLKNKYKINPIEKTLIGGMERIDPLRGKEYILDISLKLDKAKSKIFRINCVRPFSDIQFFKDEDLSSPDSSIDKALHLIVSAHSVDLDHKLIDNLFIYLAKFLFKLVNRESLRVYIVVDPDYSKIHSVKAAVKRFNEETAGPSLIKLLLYASKSFSLSGARQFALEQMPTRAVKLGFLDLSRTVVTDYLGEFINRCGVSLNEDLQHIAYSPIPFVIFANSSVTTKGLLPSASDDYPIISGKYGFWDSDDYSTLCIRKDTMKVVSSLMSTDSSKDSWSVYAETMQNLILKRILLIRSVDPALYVSYKGYNCADLQRLKVLPLKECQKRN